MLVAHRLTTVHSADHIAYLADGEIKECGTHEDLLSHNGHYAAYWHLTTTPSD